MEASPAILITFARPEESRAFRKRLSDKRHDGQTGTLCGSLNGAKIEILHTGIGPDAARSSLTRILDLRAFSRVVISGFAGALAPSLAVGDILAAKFYGPATQPAFPIISRSLPVESTAEKATLHLKTGAQAVDMESEVIGSICRDRGIPAEIMRAISDAATEPLPVPFSIWYDLAKQRPRVLPLLRFLACHPTRILPFAKFVASLPNTARKLASALVEQIKSAP